MEHSKVIKKDDGSQIKIDILISLSCLSEISLKYRVLKKEKGKRSWSPVFDKESLSFRENTLTERLKLSGVEYLKHVTKEEIESAKSEALDKLSKELLSTEMESVF